MIVDTHRHHLKTLDPNFLSVKNDIDYIAHLPSKHQKIIKEYLLGFTYQEIQDKHNVSMGLISKVINNPHTQSYIAKTQEEEYIAIDNGLKVLRTKALNRINGLIDSEDEKVALQASKEILTRTGHNPVQKIEKTETITIEQKLNDLMNETMDDYVDVDYAEDSEESETIL